jgi:phosphatidylserine decarboxylase
MLEFLKILLNCHRFYFVIGWACVSCTPKTGQLVKVEKSKLTTARKGIK